MTAAGPGPLAEEAGKLVDAVQDWAARTLPAAEHPTEAGSCSWCPVCQGLAVLRGERPEVTGRITDAVAAAAGALSALAAALARPAPPGPPAGDPAPTPPAGRGSPSPVLRDIPLD